ncbi:MAG: hypothetical protein JRG94_19875 [Deltaproteobacteria bacterium]|nr:hypothetical protein [Deltaproteobacteria bacterium]MBW2694287.1 hypothetical protein [Deltaproteobacteria bacterium]
MLFQTLTPRSSGILACLLLPLMLLSSHGCGDSPGSGASDDWFCGSRPDPFVVAADKLFFGAGGGRGDGRSLWVIDGDRRPSLVEDLADSGIGPGWNQYDFVVHNGQLYFFGFDSKNDSERGIWRTDGSESRRIDISALEGQSKYRSAVSLGDAIYFSALLGFDNGNWDHSNIWRLDNDDQFSLVTQTPGKRAISNLTAFEDRLIFSTLRKHSAPREIELWELLLGPGETPRKIADLNASASNFQVLEGVLFFAVDKEYVWSYNGVDPPVRAAVGGLVTDSVLFDGEIYYSHGFSPDLRAFSPDRGDRLIDRANAAASGIRIIDIFDGRILVGARFGELWILSDTGVLQKIDYEGRETVTGTQGTAYRGNVWFGVGKEKDEELWAFDGERTQRVKAASPGLDCADRVSTDN